MFYSTGKYFANFDNQLRSTPGGGNYFGEPGPEGTAVYTGHTSGRFKKIPRETCQDLKR